MSKVSFGYGSYNAESICCLSESNESKENSNNQSISSINSVNKGYIDHNISSLEFNTRLDIYNEAHRVRQTGIICTIGPASKEVDTLISLMKAGLNVVRLNFSHGSHEYHTQTVANARKAATVLGRDICIALDTKGPEIRTGNFKKYTNSKGELTDEYMLKTGSAVRLSIDSKYMENGNDKIFFVDYKLIVRMSIGSIVYLDDGLVSLKVVSVGKDFIDTLVENGGPISSHKGVNLPGTKVLLPALSTKDKNDFKLGVLTLDIDMVFASFIRTKQDVLDIRNELCKLDSVKGKRIQIISKIENHEGVQNFDEILSVTDGVMVARGDLGIEIEPEKVFLAQKMMISKCNIAGKPVIVATQMLESMIKNPRPTRAEVSDVANAVLDGADCVMLSGETAKGKYPKFAVEMMAKICREAETGRNTYQYFQQLNATLSKPLPTPDTIASTAVQACYEHHLKTIIVLTNSGITARLVSKFRPPVPIIAVVGKSHSFTSRQLSITTGVYPITYEDKPKQSADERVKIAIEFAKKMKWVESNDAVCAVHADKLGRGFANLIRIIHV